MTYDEQTDALTNDMVALVTRYLNEFDLNDATVVGVLDIVKNEVMNACVEFEADFTFDINDDDDLDDVDGLDDLFKD